MQRDESIADLMSATEALLFVSDDSVSCNKLAQMLEVTPGEMEIVLTALAAEYEQDNRGMQLREVAGGWRFFTHPAHHDLIERYVISWDTRRLSQAALEALAVIAYHQPVTRAGINAVRGVNSEGVVSSLIDKGLVREMGRDKGPGGAILYGTTRTFLEKFGLKSVADLPPLEDFAPDEASREYIRERLSGMGAQAASGQMDLEEVDDEEPRTDLADVRLTGTDGRIVVEEVDRGDDERVDDPAAMAQIIGQAVTDKADEAPLPRPQTDMNDVGDAAEAAGASDTPGAADTVRSADSVDSADGAGEEDAEGSTKLLDGSDAVGAEDTAGTAGGEEPASGEDEDA